MFTEQENGVNDFKLIRCINVILVSVGRSDLFRNDSVHNQNSVKSYFTKLSDIYFQEWNENVNISSKGKQYLIFTDILNFEKYFINISKFYHAKIVKYRTGNHRLLYETGRWDDTPLK